MNRCKLTVFSFLFVLVTSLFTVPAAFAWDPPAGGLDFMNVIVDKALLDNQPLAAGVQIGVFAPGDVIAGLGTVENPGDPVGFAVYADDPIVEGRQGFFAGEPLTFKFYDPNADKEYDADITWSDGQAIYSNDTVLRVKLAAGSGAPNIVLSAVDRDFGDVKIGKNAQWTLIISNTGRDVLHVQSVTSNSGAFTHDFGANPVDIDAGASKNVVVTFTPTNAIAYTAKLTVVSNDADEGSLVVNLAGSGSAVIPGGAILSSTTRSYGQVVVNSQADWVLRITNGGEQNLTINAMTLAEGVPYKTDFGDQPVIVGAGATKNVTVTFAPVNEGVFAADLVVDVGKADQNPKVHLLGEGIVIKNPNMSLGNVSVKDGSYSLFMGNVVVGGSFTQQVLVKNADDAEGNLNVTGVTLEGDMFSVAFPVTGIRLRPGDAIKVPVTFTPKGIQFYVGTLTLHSNQPGQRDADVAVALAGAGGDPNGVDFGHFRYRPTDNSHTITVMSAKLDNVLLAPGDEVGVFTPTGICAGAGTIRRQGQEVRATVTAWGDDPANAVVDGFRADQPFVFKVWAAEAKTEAVANANFTNGPEVFAGNGDSQVELDAATPKGTPQISLSANDFVFGQVLVAGSVVKKTVTIANKGAVALTVDSISSDNAAFITDFLPAKGNINPNGSLDVVISFDPTEERSYLARLTVYSNDPANGELYVDLHGEGVLNVNPQKLMVSSNNTNMGIKRLGGRYTASVMISNAGGADAVISGITTTGDDVFSIDWANRTTLGAGDSKMLNVTFAPVNEGKYSTDIKIMWNDPVGNGEIHVMVYGRGQAFGTRWAALPTANIHYLRAAGFIHDGDNMVPLRVGSEIGVFTPAGLCAGLAVVDADPLAKFEVYGDDAATPEVDGFKANERFTFKIWDRDRWSELTASLEVVGGPDRWIAGKTSIFNLYAEAPKVPTITVDMPGYSFGVVQLNTPSAAARFTIKNTGAEDVTINSVESSDPSIFIVRFQNAGIKLPQDSTTKINVTFQPVAKGPMVATIAAITDKGVFVFHPLGIGGTGAHWAIYPTESNQTILMTKVVYGAAAMAVGDEVGVFTPDGLCAGAGVAIEPGKVGIAAFGDDALTSDVVEGFKDGQAITFKFYDQSQNKEYSEGIKGLPQNLVWSNNAFTAIQDSVVVPGIFSVLNPGTQFNDEGDEVAFDLKLSGLAQGAQVTMMYKGAEQLPGENPVVNYNAQTKIGHVTWQTDLNSAGTHEIGVMTYAVSGQDTTAEYIKIEAQITNVNQAPALIRANLPQDLADDDILTVAKNQPDIVFNPFTWFTDPDMDQVMIDYEADNSDLLRLNLDYDNMKFTISPIRDQIGPTVVTFRANDLIDRDNAQGVFGKRFAHTIGNTRNSSKLGPTRDLVTEYRFTIQLIDGKRPVVAEDGIPLAAINEDDSLDVGDLDNFIADPDGGALQFSALDVPQDYLKVAISQTNELTIKTAMKDFWSPDTMMFTIKAKDPTNLTAFTNVYVLINSVNDAPAAFGLLTPEKFEVINNLAPAMVNFSWEESAQNQWEKGIITYKLYCYLEQDLINFIEKPIPPEDGTKFSIPIPEFNAMLSANPEQKNLFTWWVKAFDEEGAELASRDKFTFWIEAIGVDREFSTIPTKLEFDGNYPNPFNGLTTVKFGVPNNGPVDVTVWDMSGRRVATLVKANLSAGWHTATFDANGLATGVYLIRVANGSSSILKKAVLIR